MKKIIIGLVLVFIGLFAVKTSVFAFNHIDMLEDYKVKVFSDKKKAKKYYKKVLNKHWDDVNKSALRESYEKLTKSQKKAANKGAGISNVDDDESLKKFVIWALTEGSTTENMANLDLNKVKSKFNCKSFKFLHPYWVVLEILAPILVILFGTFDFVKSVMGSDEQKIIAARKKFPKRMIAGALMFFAFTIISIACGISANKAVNDTSLIRCIVTGK